MSSYSLQDTKPLTLLKEAFGEEVTLEDQGMDSQPYKILAEFELEGRGYAVLQSEGMKREDEVALFRIVLDEQGELQLETVEDDEEWENVLELYDEMTVSFE